MKHTTARSAPTARLSTIAAALGLALFASCHTTSPRYNHWRFEGLTPRLAYHFLSYDTNSGVPYRDHVSEQRIANRKTLARHLLSWNPDNPFQNRLPHIRGRSYFSPLPNPFHFFGLSSVALAGATVGAGGAAIFFPPEAIIVLFEEGGAEEMAEGVERTFSGRLQEPEMPPDPSEFRVKHR